MNTRNKTLILGLLSAFLIIAFLVINKVAFLVNLDNTVYNWIISHQSPFISRAMLSITNIGDVYGTILIFMVFGLFLFLKGKKTFFTFALAASSGVALTETIKHLVQRARPFNLLEQGFSFPSAHAMISTVFLLSSIFLLAPLMKRPFSKYVFLIATSIIFPLVAFSRIYLSVHFTSDVVAGMILGTICFIISGIICCHKKENVL